MCQVVHKKSFDRLGINIHSKMIVLLEKFITAFADYIHMHKTC